jgi:hypothetical protein
VSTDAQADLTGWDVTLISGSPPTNVGLFTCSGISSYFNSCPTYSYDSSYISNGFPNGMVDSDPGTWTTALTLQGGTPETATLLIGDGDVSQIYGMIGGSDNQEFYAFYWSGGNFGYTITGDLTFSSAFSSIYGLQPDPQCAENETSECYFINGQGFFLPAEYFNSDFNCGELDGAPGCQTAGGAFLAPGWYEVGVTYSGADPNFTLAFDAPVNTNVPEPLTAALLSNRCAGIVRPRPKEGG